LSRISKLQHVEPTVAIIKVVNMFGTKNKRMSAVTQSNIQRLTLFAILLRIAKYLYLILLQISVAKVSCMLWITFNKHTLNIVNLLFIINIINGHGY
jgi:hypothetical protein